MGTGKGNGFTPRQRILLLITAILGTAWIGLAVFALRAWGQSAAVSAPQPVQISSPMPGSLPPTWTPPGPGSPLAVSAACAQSGSVEQGVVTGIQEAGALEVQVGAERQVIALAGIRMAPAGPVLVESTRVLGELAGQPVLLSRGAPDVDDAGRKLRYVFAGETFVNLDLVRRGLAAADPQSPEQSCAAQFSEAEQRARLEGAGQWQATAVPTATFLPFVTLDPRRAACDCSVRYECTDFVTRGDAQTCYNACNDYNSRLDDDRDGVACEELPQ